ncbi:hypothetical protein OCS_04470 [Ophiocordyceps sinensis CO18]|uniref:Uncharacterized protein n=1 Tax=Ophiocordyceps sinensis (strain Co18 / CGMCC 3.14243) TaxID=911162 RepID=T5ABL8_OPHSC|nr:hypothetical protein OCS_04470 [Ophiocordyceps sinensis CO18]
MLETSIRIRLREGINGHVRSISDASEALDEYWNDEHGLNKELGVVSGLATNVRIDWPGVLHELAQTHGSPAVGPVNVCPDDDSQARPWNRLLLSVAVGGQLVLDLRVDAGNMMLPTMHLQRQGVALSELRARHEDVQGGRHRPGQPRRHGGLCLREPAEVYAPRLHNPSRE